MYYLKNILFLYLTKNQKASLFSYIKSFAKKYKDLSTDEILDAFIEEEKYYFNVNNPHFEWISEYLEQEKFLKELKTLINENKKQLELKEKQKPFLEKQKLLAKEQRKKAAEYKMSKEKTKKKQIYYYNKLCDQYKITKEDLTNKSKLDLKNIIGKILDEQASSEKGFDRDIQE